MSILIKDKIAIVVDCNPFESTPSLTLADELARRLKNFGDDAYVTKVPVDWSNGDTLMQSILSLRLLKIMNADAVLAINFPAAIVQHHNKYAWLTETVDNTARLRYEETLLQAAGKESDVNQQTPHRLAILQELLAKIADSYQPECKKIVYCHNAIKPESEDIDDDASGNQFSDLTSVLKGALNKLRNEDAKREQQPLEQLVVPAFESTPDRLEQYLAALPWEAITKHLTRTLEIE